MGDGVGDFGVQGWGERFICGAGTPLCAPRFGPFFMLGSGTVAMGIYACSLTGEYCEYHIVWAAVALHGMFGAAMANR